MRVLVAVDLSAVSARVLAAAADFARPSRAQLWLLHVAAPDPAFIGYDAGTPGVRDQVAHELREEHRNLQAHAAALRTSGFDATALLVRGPTAQTILAEAARLQVDLIVMATHGHGAMFDLLVGSVGHAVLRGSRTPVLMIPARN